MAARAVLMLLAMLGCLLAADHAEASELSDQDELFRRLVAPMKSVVDGKSFRDALATIANQAQVNLWLDRRVDPTVPVALGVVGPTAFAAIDKLAKSRDCAVMPIANVLLVGRASWVDQTAALIMNLPSDSTLPSIDVDWEDLTTPKEALIAVAGADVNVTPTLPHDLWPSTTWRGIDRHVAIVLILSQFNVQADTSRDITALTTHPIDADGVCVGRYSLGELNADLRESFQHYDQRGKFDSKSSVRKGTLVYKGPIAVHRQAIVSVMESIRPQATDIDESTFTIKQMHTSAKNAFEQLAKMAGRTCQIEAAAVQTCTTIVSLEAADLTLRQLVDRVAIEAGVTATWSTDTIVISVPERQER